MRFAFWYYTGKLGIVLFVLAIVAALFSHNGSLPETILHATLGVIVMLGVVGAVMGVLLATGRLRMKCPFCGTPGRVGGSRSEGMWMECGACGHVHGSGFLGLQLVADLEDPAVEDESDASTDSGGGEA